MAESLGSEDQFEVKIQAQNGQELIDQMSRQPIDVIILDLDMPILDGQDTLKLVRKRFDSDIKVIILSMHYEENYIRKYLKSGANSYLGKGCQYETLVECIEEVYSSGIFFHDKVSPKLVEELLNDESTTFRVLEGEALSRAEIQVLKLLCKGYSSSKISELLGRSSRTIDNHRYRMMKKLGLHNSMELMKYAIVHKYHEPSY
jgi:DNA-binding NarL/FixJ family response regulator